MGSEQSSTQATGPNPGFGTIAYGGRSFDGLRNETVAGSSFGTSRRDRTRRTFSDESLSTVTSTESRPASPPISIYSDSDLPYISYTDKPIGESPSKRRSNKSQLANKLMRNGGSSTSNLQGTVKKTKNPTAHSIVIVRPGPVVPVRQSDITKLQSIPQFLPVIRGTIALPTNRDPEVLERLQPVHLQNICSRLQVFLSEGANKIVADQNGVYHKMHHVDVEVDRVHSDNVAREIQYSQMAESFSKVKQIGNQLAHCNALLNQNLESITELNALLPQELQLMPFVWTTN